MVGLIALNVAEVLHRCPSNLVAAGSSRKDVSLAVLGRNNDGLKLSSM